jgi:transcriptional regulator with XRE-family HTH domain
MRKAHIAGMTLAEFMKAEGLTDKQVAEFTGRALSNVCRWRNGHTKPDFGALVALEKLSNGRVTASAFAASEAA